MRILYFAWVRERIGKGEETLDLPDSIITVADLAGWLATRGDEYARAFERPQFIRAAIDRMQVKPNTPIGAAKEIAFFPPMTGG